MRIKWLRSVSMCCWNTKSAYWYCFNAHMCYPPFIHRPLDKQLRICGRGAHLSLYCPQLRSPHQEEWSVLAWGREENKKSLWKSTSYQCDRSAWKPGARFVPVFDVGGCKKLKNRSTHTHTWEAVCCLSSPPTPVCPMISIGVCVFVCVWMNNRRPFYYEWWRTWRDIKVIHTRQEEDRGMTVEIRLLTNNSGVSHISWVSRRGVCGQFPTSNTSLPICSFRWGCYKVS